MEISLNALLIPHSYLCLENNNTKMSLDDIRKRNLRYLSKVLDVNFEEHVNSITSRSMMVDIMLDCLRFAFNEGLSEIKIKFYVKILLRFLQ